MKVCVILFDRYETLDVFGPVEILGRVPGHFEIDYYSVEGGIKTSTQGVSISTQKLSATDNNCDILLIPGGIGTRKEVDNQELVEITRSLSQQSRYTLTVCTGSALLAQSGLLDGRVATSNKRAFNWVKSIRQQVLWKHKARWTVDGKYYTSSGISAGMDMTLGFISNILGMEHAERVAWEMEYMWNNDPEDDRFAR